MSRELKNSVTLNGDGVNYDVKINRKEYQSSL